MRSTVICILALALGVELTLGKSLFQGLNKIRRKLEKYDENSSDSEEAGDSVGSREEVIAHIKDEILKGWEEMEETCPASFEPDCSAIDDDIKEILDHVYEGTTEENEEAIKTTIAQIENTLKSSGLSDAEMNCTAYMCLFGVVYQKHAAGEMLPFCEADLCEYRKRAMGQGKLDHGKRRPDKGGKGRKKSEDEDIMYALCGAEIYFDECTDTDEECAGIIAETMYDRIEKCYEDNGQNEVQQRSYKDLGKSNKESLIQRLKRLLAEREARKTFDVKRVLERLGI